MIEEYSPTWNALRAWASDQLDAAQEALAWVGCEPRQADQLRGRIDLLKEMLALPKAATHTPPER